MAKQSQSYNKGAQLCARFAYKPNALHYCGSKEASNRLYRCIVYNSCSNLEPEFKTFKALYPYLKTISNKLKLPLLDHKVTEAYWLGNDKLSGFSIKDYEMLLQELTKQNVPAKFISDLKRHHNKSSSKFIPHHSYNVLFVGVGNVTGSVVYNLANVNDCLVRAGEVIDYKQDQATLGTKRLKFEGNSLKFISSMEKVHVDTRIIPGLKVGNIIACHWHEAVMKISPQQGRTIWSWTKRVVDLFNSTGFQRLH